MATGVTPKLGVIVDDTPEVHEMAHSAPYEASAAQDTPILDAELPTIDPRTLSPAQQDGRRCAVPNCRRPLAGTAYQVGRLPGGEPVMACSDCGPEVCYEPQVSYEVSQDLESRGMIPEQRRWRPRPSVLRHGPGHGQAA
jgi:hypothetical protein